MAAPGVVRWYERNLAAEVNPARWWEYSLSASLMVVLIAMLTGLRDVGALIGLFGANAAMILPRMSVPPVSRGPSARDPQSQGSIPRPARAQQGLVPHGPRP